MVRRWLDETHQSIPLFQVVFSGNTYETKLSPLDQIEAPTELSRSAMVNKDIQPDMTSLVLDGLDPLLRQIALAAKGEPHNAQAVSSGMNTVEQNGYKIRKPVEKILQGERDAAKLTANLDELDTKIINRLVEILNG